MKKVLIVMLLLISVVIFADNAFKHFEEPVDTRVGYTGVEFQRNTRARLSESFESGVPSDWTVVNNDGGAYTWAQDYTYAHSGSSSVSKMWESPSDDWLITPQITVEENDVLTLWARSYMSYFAEHITVWASTTDNNVDSFTIQLADDSAVPAEWTKYTIDFADYAEINTGDEIYLAFQCTSYDCYWLYLDDVQVAPLPTEPILSISNNVIDFGEVMVFEVSELPNSVMITNTGGGMLEFTNVTDLAGTEFSTDFDINTTLGMDESMSFGFTYEPFNTGLDEVEFVIESNAGDPVTISLSGTGYSLPEGMVEIGTETLEFFLPVRSSYNYSYSQSIFRQDEINMEGQQVEKLYYYYNGYTEMDMDASIYMGHTTMTDFGDPLPLGQLVEVFNGTISCTAEAGWVEILLDTPFYYNNMSNLVIALDDNTGTQFEEMNRFYNTLDSHTSSYINWSETDIDPASPTRFSYTYRPNIRLQFEEGTPSPILGLSTNELDYGIVNVGQNLPIDVTVTNIGSGDLSFESVDGLDGSGFFHNFDLNTILGALEEYTFTITYSPLEEGLEEAVMTITSNAGTAEITLSGEGYQLPEGLVEIGTGQETNRSLPMEPYYGYSLSETIYLQEEINMQNKRISEISYYYNGGNGWPGDDIQIFMSHTTQSSISDWITADQLTLVYNGTFAVPAEAGWVTLQLDQPFVYNNTDNLLVMFEENTPGYHSSTDEFLNTATTETRSIYFYSDGTNPDPFTPPAGNTTAYMPNVRLLFEDIPTVPVLSINTEEHDFGSMYEGAISEPLNVTISNLGGADLEFTSVTDLTGSDFVTDFVQSTVIVPTSSYSFTLTYMPSDVGVDEIEFIIESNGGNATISLSGEGVFAPQGEVVIGEDTNIDIHMPMEPYYGYTLSQSIFLQSEIVQADQRIEQISYYYAGGSGWTGDAITIMMGHTEQSTVDNWIPCNELTTVYDGTFDVAAEAGWVTINLDIPFVYNNTDNLVVQFDENTTGWHSSADDFYGTDSGANRSIYYYNDSSNPDPLNPPAGTISTYRPNVKLVFFDIPTDPIINVNPEELAFPTISAGQETVLLLNIVNGGGGELVVEEIATEAPFSCDWTGSVMQGENELVPVTFSPSEEGDYTGELVITSNALNASEITVDLSGSATPEGTWFEGFESGLVPPEGWDISWQYGFELGTGDNAYEGAYSMALDGTENSWLFSPQVEIDEESSFSFYYKAENTNDDTRLGLFIAPGHIDHNDISYYEGPLFEVTVDDPDNWTLQEYDFDGYDGLYYLAIRRTYTGDWGTYDKAFFDNLVMPALHPQGLTPEPPVFSHETDKYAEPFELTITTETPGAEIRYTTDGSYPTCYSTLYEGPIYVDQSQTIYAIACADDMDPSEKVRNTFVITTPGDFALSESFENWPPEDWTIYSADGNDNNWQQYSGSGYISSYEGYHAAEVIQTADSNEDWLVTPRIIPTEDHHTISFWATSATQGHFMDFMVKLSTNGEELYNFNTILGDYNGLNRQWRPYVFNLEEYIGMPVNIAIVADAANQFRFFVDDFEGPELFYYTIDLEMMSLNLSDILYEGTNNGFSVTIRNTGVNDITDYNIELFGNDESLAEFDGSAIDAGEILDLNFTWTPEVSGSYDIYAQVNVNGDENNSNNTTDASRYFILPEGSESLTIGEGYEQSTIPINYSWEYSLGQILYLSEDINTAGDIHGLSLTSNFEQYTEAMPVKVWIGETGMDNLEEWVPTADMELVFDSYMTTETGMQNYIIPFDQPYNYSGGNLAVMVANNHGDYLYGGHNFMCTETNQPFRSRVGIHYTAINPDDPSSSLIDYDYSLVPNIQLFYQEGEVGNLEGTVTDGRMPIEDAFVQITDTYHSTYTDASGFYSFENILTGDYELTIEKHGYSDYSDEFTISTDAVTVLDAQLTGYDLFNFSGHIILSDSQVAAEGAQVILTGYDDFYETYTDANGDFAIENIYGAHYYQYQIFYSDYYSVISGSFYLDENIEMNDLILSEIANRPLNAHFEVDHNEDGYITWEPPYPEVVPEVCEGFESGELPEGWEVIQTCTTTNTTPGWWTVNSQILEPDLVPTGNYHVGLWWTNDLQDEMLITPEFFVPPTGYIEFDSYVWEGDYQGTGDCCTVEVTTDDGVSWETVWSNSDLTLNNWNPYDHPYNIDLSAYAEQNVKVAFHADGNGDGLSYIWFIDNVIFGSNIRLNTPNTTIAADNSNFSFDANLLSGSETAQFTIDGNEPEPSNNGRSFENSYDLYLVRWENIDNPETWEILAQNYQDTIYIDENWTSYPWGEYLIAVKANYSNGVQSAASISNHQQKDMYTDVNIQLTSNIGEVPANAELHLFRQYPDPVGNEYSYDTTGDVNGQVALADVRKGHYSIEVVAFGFEEALFTDVFIEDSGLITLEMEEKLIPPLNVTAEIDAFTNNVNLEWTVPEPGLPTEFMHDDGIIYTGLGLGQPTENAAFGVCYYNHAVVEVLKWYLGGNNSVRVVVLGLDEFGMPDQADLLFDTGLIDNTPNQWNEFELTQIIEAPNGFFVAIMTPFVFQNLGIDDGVGEPYVFEYGRQFITLDIFSGANEWLTDDNSHPNNWMIRAEGLNIEDLTFRQEPASVETIETLCQQFSGFALGTQSSEKKYTSTMRTRDYESFDVYRIVSGNEEMPETWEHINALAITELNYIDNTWNDVLPGDYRYAVVANYEYGISDPGFSNIVTEEVWGTLSGTVIDALSGDPIVNARIVAGEDEEYTNETGEYALLLNPGIWEIQCYADGYSRGDAEVEITANETAVADFSLYEQLAVPYNLEAEVENYNDVNLNWDAPVYGGGDSGWIKWDSGINVEGIGTGNAAVMEAAIRFDENDIAPYAGGLLTRVKIYPREAECTYTLRIWGYGATEVIYEQPLSTVIANSWNEITLIDPVYLTGEEIWIGYEANTAGGYPLGAGEGPMVLNKGGWLRMSGGVWNQLTSINPSLNYNWNIQGYVLPTEGREIVFNAGDDEEYFSEPLTQKISEYKTALVTNSGISMNREFLGYNVYRNDEMIATVSELNYIDENLMSGDYSYNVTAQYSSGESNFSNQVTVNLELGNAPQNITWAVEEYSVDLGWDAPENTEALLGYNVYRNGESVNESVIINTVFTDTISAPDNYEYFVTSVYEYGESLPSEVVNLDMYEFIMFGDTNQNWLVEAYDGALVLQYVVGYDPMPEIDPRPWEEWRLIQCDVDGNDAIGAYDAGLILQYTVGMIDVFPADNQSRIALPEAVIEMEVSQNIVYLKAEGELIAFSFESRFTGMDTPQALKTAQSAFNCDDDITAFAMASAENLAGETAFLKIPFNSLPEEEVELAVVINNKLSTLNITPEMFTNDQAPLVTELIGNYPNPFNPTTAIKYNLSENSSVMLEIYDIKGRRIAQIVNEQQDAGFHQAIWNGETQSSAQSASSVYFYKLTVNGKSFIDKMLLLK